MKDGDWFEKIVEFFADVVGAKVKDTVQDFTHTTQKVVYETTRNALRLIFMSILGLIAVVLLLISVVLLIKQYAGISAGWTMLMISAVILVVIAYIAKQFDKNKMYKF